MAINPRVDPELTHNAGWPGLPPSEYPVSGATVVCESDNLKPRRVAGHSPDNPRRSRQAALGTNTKTRTPPNPTAARRRRYDLLDVVRRIQPEGRAAGCSRFTIPGEEGGVVVNHNAAQGTAHYSGVSVCSDLWACPVCATRIMAKRRHELQAGIQEARRLGWSVVLVTVTLRHGAGDRLGALVSDLVDAWTRTKRGAPWDRLKARYGIQGEVMALEVTHGGNGWHPHRHMLFFLDHEPHNGEAEALEADLTKRFRKMAGKLGRYVSGDWGVDVRGNDSADGYVSKLDAELTDQEYKTGGGVSPFAILKAAGDGDKRAVALWTEYTEAMHGRRRLVWSKVQGDDGKLIGLNKALGVADLTDQDAAELPEDDAAGSVSLVVLDGQQFARVVRLGKRGELLTIAATTGSKTAVWAYLRHECGIIYAPWNREREQAARALDALGDSLMLTEARAAVALGDFVEVTG